MLLDVELKEWGNSYGIRIPKRLAKELDLRQGEIFTVDMPVKKDNIEDFFGIYKGAPSFVRDHDDRF